MPGSLLSMNPSPGAREWTAEDGRKSLLDSQNPAVQRLLRQVAILGPTQLAVLIIAETGAGKEVLAGVLAEAGSGERSVITVNCGELGRDLAAARLFGYVRGAYTGASVNGSEGAVTRANRGVLFLDEIGALALDCQPPLLRVLDLGTYSPVGSSQTLRSQFRFIAATNRDLARAVAEGTFQKDLYYRIGDVVLTIPPLREREEDIIPLARRMVERLSGGRSTLGADAEALLLKHAWPGNVRELLLTLRTAVTLSSEAVISASDLLFRPDPISAAPVVIADAARAIQDGHTDGHTDGGGEGVHGEVGASDHQVEEEELGLDANIAVLVSRALELENGDVAGAAKRMRISRARFNRLREELLEKGHEI